MRVTVLAPFHRAYEQWSAVSSQASYIRCVLLYNRPKPCVIRLCFNHCQDLVGAARNDHLDIVQFIINNNKSDVNARESDRVMCDKCFSALLYITLNDPYSTVGHH